MAIDAKSIVSFEVSLQWPLDRCQRQRTDALRRPSLSRTVGPSGTVGPGPDRVLSGGENFQSQLSKILIPVPTGFMFGHKRYIKQYINFVLKYLLSSEILIVSPMFTC